MSPLDVHTAKDQLEELIDRAANGEEVIITRGDGAAFRLVPALSNAPRPRFGSAKDQVRMSADFDAPLDDFDEYLPGS